MGEEDRAGLLADRERPVQITAGDQAVARNLGVVPDRWACIWLCHSSTQVTGGCCASLSLHLLICKVEGHDNYSRGGFRTPPLGSAW